MSEYLGIPGYYSGDAVLSFSGYTPDINTGTVPASIPLPVRCKLLKVSVSISAANSTTATVLTITDQDDTAIGTITIPATGAAAGDVFDFCVNSQVVYSAGSAILITSDEAGAPAVAAHYVLMVEMAKS